MKFPNAAKGVKKLFSAEILYLLSVILIGVVSVITVIINNKMTNVSNAVAVLILVGFIAGGVLAVIAFILQIVGLVQASRDERAFKGVILLTVFGIIVSVIGAFFSKDSFINSLSTTINSVVSVISIILIILGIGNMSLQLERQDMIERGGRIIRIIVWLAIISIIMNLISIFLNIDSQLNAILHILIIRLLQHLMNLLNLQFIIETKQLTLPAAKATGIPKKFGIC